MNTRKYPRTLNEAFGPYTSSHIEEPKQPMDWQDVVVIAGAVTTFLIAVLIGVLS